MKPIDLQQMTINRWIHKEVNRMKWDFDQNYFIYLCKRVDECQKVR